MTDTLWLFFLKAFSLRFISVNDCFSVTCSSFSSMAALLIELMIQFSDCRMIEACVWAGDGGVD